MELTYTHRTEHKTALFSQLIADVTFNVDYCPKQRKVTEIIDVWAHNGKDSAIDVTRVFMELFDLDGKIETICDWHEIYANELETA